MKVAIEKLLSICSDEISISDEVKDYTSLYELPLISELKNLLDAKNGFYGFESALHVYPFETVGAEIGLLDWNNHDLWISAYDDLALEGVYFAEDIFGGQFSIKRDGVYAFEPETGISEKIANSLDNWCDIILKDYDFLTGYSLSHAWQEKNGKLPVGYRLIPKIPFLMGGGFDVGNLYMEKSDIAMKLRAGIALQIKQLKDGDSVTIKLS